jgi:hypothetical protein
MKNFQPCGSIVDANPAILWQLTHWDSEAPSTGKNFRPGLASQYYAFNPKAFSSWYRDCCIKHEAMRPGLMGRAAGEETI